MKVKICSLFLILALLSASVAFSAELVTTSVSYNSNTASISVTGSAVGDVLIMIAPYGADPVALSDGSVRAVYLRQLYSTGTPKILSCLAKYRVYK